MAGKERTLSVAAMVAKVLCARHNNALGPLDDVAISLQRFLREDQNSLNRLRDTPDGSSVVSSMTLLSGPMLELWLLKTAWAAAVSGTTGLNGEKTLGLSTSVDEAALSDTLFRGKPWPPGWGFYIPAYVSAPQVKAGDVAITPLVGSRNEMLAAAIEFGSVRLNVGLGVVGGEVTMQPGGVVIASADGSVTRTTALAWPDGGHVPVTMMRPQ